MPRLHAAVLALAASLPLACHGAPPPVAETSVKPGINQDFVDPALDVAKYEQRFEGESREIFAQRGKIAALAGVREGMAVADVGAGTGLFTFLFATRVGDEGRVYAVDIAPRFIDHIRDVAKQRSLANVEAVLCSDRSVELPPASVDAVFVCDTYHHFEYPKNTLASIHRALRPSGTLLVVDFIRIPGTSRPWILEHVRAGQDEVTREIEAAGFRKVRDEDSSFLHENYVMRFVKA
ncbi:MAG: class I SAM-dependent methyltransferase [Planctomycetota bacterium]